jgi:hypothetical protein
MLRHWQTRHMSIAVRMSLAAELKNMRIATGRSLNDVAVAGIAVLDTIRSIEKGERRIKPNYVKQLCELYGADPQTKRLLMEMATNNEKGWWEPYSHLLNPKFKFFLQAESSAHTVLTYDSELLYGLLQTPTYHRAVYAADPAAPASAVDQEITFRTERQKATLGRTPPLHIQAIMNEAVLVRQFPGLEEQRAHLLAMSHQPNIKLYVLPWSAGPHAAMSGPFKIVDFSLPNVPDLVYLETSGGVRYTEEKDVVEGHRARFHHVRQQAIALEEYLA